MEKNIQKIQDSQAFRLFFTFSETGCNGDPVPHKTATYQLTVSWEVH